MTSIVLETLAWLSLPLYLLSPRFREWVITGEAP